EVRSMASAARIVTPEIETTTVPNRVIQLLQSRGRKTTRRLNGLNMAMAPVGGGGEMRAGDGGTCARQGCRRRIFAIGGQWAHDGVVQHKGRAIALAA